MSDVLDIKTLMSDSDVMPVQQPVLPSLMVRPVQYNKILSYTPKLSSSSSMSTGLFHSLCRRRHNAVAMSTPLSRNRKS